MSNYLDATNDLYRDAAITPDVGLCCTTTPMWVLPGLEMPKIMKEMNYGCGSTVNPRDLINNPKILYVGVGGGMELLQFAYFSRQKGGVIGIDILPEMLEASRKNFVEAEKLNPWFKSEFVNLELGDAMKLPVADESIDVAAQNCVFNIFREDDVVTALKEVYRTLKPHGRLVMSDPICDQDMPENLRADDRLRALCLSGSLPLVKYLELIVKAGFGTIEVRSKRPYRILAPGQYDTKETIFIESVEICAIKDPILPDGPCIFTGKTATYYGDQEYYDDKKGHILMNNQPLNICDKTARQFAELDEKFIHITDSTFFYDGGGSC